MGDKVDKYLDKVVELLVRDTTIDYDREEITYPFFSPYSSPLHSSFFFFLPPSFSIYVRDMYGLTEEELEYVWDEYKKKILDKIENGR